MRKIDSYCFVINPTIRYATFACDEIFLNLNFDDLLRDIGKYYFKKPNVGLNGICSLIKDEINREWHLNKLRKSIRRKKVSTTQIKTIRRSFVKINNSNEKYIRIPFDVVSILFFILTILKRIDDNNFNKEKYVRIMNEKTIGTYLYERHTDIFSREYDNRIMHLSDPLLIEKYKTLSSLLTGYNTFMNHYFDDIDWNNSSEYKIK